MSSCRSTGSRVLIQRFCSTEVEEEEVVAARPFPTLLVPAPRVQEERWVVVREERSSGLESGRCVGVAAQVLSVLFSLLARLRLSDKSLLCTSQWRWNEVCSRDRFVGRLLVAVAVLSAEELERKCEGCLPAPVGVESRLFLVRPGEARVIKFGSSNEVSSFRLK